MHACSDGYKRVEYLQLVEQHAQSISEDEWRQKWDQGDVQGLWDGLSQCVRAAMVESFPRVAYDAAEYEAMRDER
eukprot:1994602-Pyramimonas_sp.AAC.1